MANATRTLLYYIFVFFFWLHLLHRYPNRLRQGSHLALEAASLTSAQALYRIGGWLLVREASAALK